MNFKEFIHSVIDETLILNKSSVYCNTTIHNHRYTCKYFDNNEEKLEIDVWSYDYNFIKEMKKMKSKFNWENKIYGSDNELFNAYQNSNGSYHIKFNITNRIDSEIYEKSIVAIKQIIEYINDMEEIHD